MEKNRAIFSWKERENHLEKMERYGEFSVMFYRTNLSIHSKRVEGLLGIILPSIKELYPDFDEDKARLIARHHDDFEIVLEEGDVSLQLKLMMNGEEKYQLKQKEVAAVELLSSFCPKKVKGYSYKQILLHAVFKDCVEAQAVSFVDKVDGYCEAIHEVLAGNTIFLEPVINYLGKTFNDLHGHFPLIQGMFSVNNKFLSFPVVDLKEFFDHGEVGTRSHDIRTIRKKASIYHYEEWKRVTIQKIGIKQLINQLEFHKTHQK